MKKQIKKQQVDEPVLYDEIDSYVRMRMGAQCVDPKCLVCPREIVAQEAVFAALKVCEALQTYPDMGTDLRVLEALANFNEKAKKVGR